VLFGCATSTKNRRERIKLLNPYIYVQLFLLQIIYDVKVKEKESSGFTATIIISLILYTIFICLFIVLNMTFLGVLSDWLRTLNRNVLIATVLILMIILEITIFIYYKKKRDKIISKYSKRPANKWFKPWMLYIFAALIMSMPYFYWQLLVLLGIR
jgi:hypothetical protein